MEDREAAKESDVSTLSTRNQDLVAHAVYRYIAAHLKDNKKEKVVIDRLVNMKIQAKTKELREQIKKGIPVEI